jgi:hypothetical protein
MTLKTRLSKLEATASTEDNGTWLQVVGDSDAECEAKRRALIDAGQAEENYNFMLRIIVTPKEAACET